MDNKPYRQYFLYLDESGDFEENRDNFSSPSLVGGILCEKDICEVRKAENIISQVREKYIVINEQYKNSNFHHATELPSEIKADVKVDMVEAIINNGFIPIIFQQKSKEKILNNTTTYISFLVDGIVKLIQDFSFHNPIELTVTIGYRQDVDIKRKKESKGELNLKNDYIKPQFIKSEFEKYITIAQIRESYNFRNKFKVHLKFANDKGDAFLVLSDYICNFYYTKESLQCKKHLNKRVMKLLNVKNTRNNSKFNTYSIYEEPEIERLKRNISDGNFGEALFFAVLINHQTEEWESFKPKLRKCLADISESELSMALNNFYAKMQLLGTFSGKSNQVIQIVDNVIGFIGYKDILRSCYDSCMARIYLFKMAALMHRGNYTQFIRISEKCESHVKASKDLNIYLMFANRMTTFYYANFQYVKSIEIGEQLLHILKKLSQEVNSIFQETGYRFNICDDQYEKICGTLALSYYGACSISKEYADQARRYSLNAMSGFVKENDKRRTAQVLAQIEAESGNYEQACNCLNYGLNVNVHSILSPDFTKGERPLSKFGDFDWYHLTKLLAVMVSSSDEQYRKLAISMIQDSFECFKNYVTRIEQQIHFPIFITFCMYARALINSTESNKYKMFARALFEKAILSTEEFKNSSPRFRAAGLVIRANYLLALLKIGNNNEFNSALQDLKEKLKDYCSSKPISEEMKSVFGWWYNGLKEITYEDKDYTKHVLSKMSRTILF
jgi:hypothetical protein